MTEKINKEGESVITKLLFDSIHLEAVILISILFIITWT